MVKTALIAIDIQNDYFEGGKWPLEGMNEASANAAMLLEVCRSKNIPVIHIRHEMPSDDAPFLTPNSDGSKIHSSVAVIASELTILKHDANSFKNTNLKKELDKLGAERVLFCGAMSNLCIDSSTRAAADLGFSCVVAHDACAASDLEFGDVSVPAKHVHAAFMAALGFAFAKIISSQELIADL